MIITLVMIITTSLRIEEDLTPTTIGVPPRTIATTRGNRTSTMAIRTTTTSTTINAFVRCGVSGKPARDTGLLVFRAIFMKERARAA